MKKCILPWIHLEATASGKAKPCCLYSFPLTKNGKIIRLNNDSIDDAWNSNDMNNLRTEFLNGGMPEGCSRCWKMEAAGKQSKRQISNQWFSHRLNRWDEPLQSPTYLDLKLGTVCNLKCRSCSSHSSSKWIEDEIKLYNKPFNSNKHSYWIDEDSTVWNEIESLIPTIEYLDFTGGEPLLIKKHFEILKKCVVDGFSKNVKLHYNTNGTILPSDDIFNIWKEFKEVTLMFSADGTKEKFEYLRHPAKWSTFINVFKEVLKHKNIHAPICYSVSVYNVMYMNEFINWFKSYDLPDDNLYFNLIFNPSYISIQSLSNEEKEKIKLYLETTKTEFPWLNLKVQEVIDFMMNNYVELINKDEFEKTTKNIDNLRYENFDKTFPELFSILKTNL
jgi:MoaA/NifB/PqqE/SkfB family radical SAM enzyme